MERKAMRLAILPALERTVNPIIVTRSLTLNRGDVFRLPRACRDLWVVSGRAWVTFDGKDIILNNGERASFKRGKDAVVVTSMGKAPLVLEIPGEKT
jgi:hypothetical protein